MEIATMCLRGLEAGHGARLRRNGVAEPVMRGLVKNIGGSPDEPLIHQKILPEGNDFSRIKTIQDSSAGLRLKLRQKIGVHNHHFIDKKRKI
jgi:hypothetical protein